MPRAEGLTYYWKVRPIDAPFDELGIFSSAQSFVYTDEDAFRVLAPEPGEVVDVPTFDWSPVPGTEKYEVSLYDRLGTRVEKVTTYSTSYTPETVLAAADGPYQWRVRGLDAGARTTMESAPRLFDISTDAPDTSTPLLTYDTPPSYDAPDLRWAPMEGAAYYTVDIGDAGSGNWFAPSYAPILTTAYSYPAATDISMALPRRRRLQLAGHRPRPDRRADRVQRDQHVHGHGAGPGHRPAARAHRVGPRRRRWPAPRRSRTGSGTCATGCRPPRCSTGTRCPTPSEYRVHVSKDGDFTSGALAPTRPGRRTRAGPPVPPIPRSPCRTARRRRPTTGSSSPASPVDVRPRPALDGQPAPGTRSEVLPQVELLSPVPNLGVADNIKDTEVTFTWKDYFDTNQATTYAATDEPSYQSAKSYEIQLVVQPTFSPVSSRRRGGPADVHLGRQALPRGAGLLARPGDRCQRQQARLVGGPEVREDESEAAR